jgi:hypothetical protein
MSIASSTLKLLLEGAQLLERQSKLPGIEHQIAAVLTVPPLGRDLDGRSSSWLTTDPDSPRVVARVAEGRGPPGADPMVAAVVLLDLLAQATLELLTQRLDVDLVQVFDPIRVYLIRLDRF